MLGSWMLVPWIPAVLTALCAGVLDWRYRRIPNWLTVSGLVAGIGANGWLFGWSGIKNGRLLRLLVDGGYEVFVTADKNLEYQQHLPELPLAILVLPTNHWKSLQPHQARVLQAFGSLKRGQVTRLD